ncbi:MAG: adenine deaminase [Oscillospiraceae bacterium]|nr:adenine deaminase [Oscillospiraceae bacterium]
MTRDALRKLIRTAAGELPADTVIKNCRVLDVFTGQFRQGDIALCGEQIAGIGNYSGLIETDAGNRYAVPGFIDSHIHIESSCLSPEELGRMLVPHGTTAVIADPHEIVNVCGVRGLDYMMSAAEYTAMDIQFMLPSCVPATPFETAGAEVTAQEMEEPIRREKILGLGEFMNFPGVLSASDAVLDKLLLAKRNGKLIDGHSPGLTGLPLNAYAAAGILGDHECASVEDMRERLALGMYVLLREGSACHDLRSLLKGVTAENSRRCLLCSDDRQPKTILREGHLDSHLRICVEEGLDPVTALRMATLNAAECFRLYNRGALAPGYRADIVLLDDLTHFRTDRVWIKGQLAAENGVYLPPVRHHDISDVMRSIHIRDFSGKKLKMHLKSSRVNVIELLPGGVVTKKSTAEVPVDAEGEFVWTKEKGIVKLAVVERHRGTGNVACGFLKGYGMQAGALALSIAHDSHNVIAAGVSDAEIAFAVEALREQNGGIVLVRDGRVIDAMPMPIAGLMSDQPGEWVAEKLEALHEKAHTQLGVSRDVDPVMTLCFMSLPVIPEIKLTDMGLFDVNKFTFIPLEAE